MLQQDNNVLQNEFLVTEQRLQNIKQEKTQFKASLKEYQKMIQNVKNLQNVLNWRGGQENEVMESFQVKMYNETIIQATLVDELEALLIFMEELIKRYKGDKKAEDRYAFNQMSQTDQERLTDGLLKAGIRYDRKWEDEEEEEEKNEEKPTAI